MKVFESVTTLREGLTSENTCIALGFAPLSSGVCVTTAAGPRGAIVPIESQPRLEEYARSPFPLA